MVIQAAPLILMLCVGDLAVGTGQAAGPGSHANAVLELVVPVVLQRGCCVGLDTTGAYHHRLGRTLHYIDNM